MSGDAARATPLIIDAAEHPRRRGHPGDLLLAGTATMFLGDDLLCAELFARGIPVARRLGTPAGLAVLLGPAAMVDMWNGRFASAAADATEGVRFAELVGAPNLATLGEGRPGLGGGRPGPAGAVPGPCGECAGPGARPRLRRGRVGRNLGPRPRRAGCGPARGGLVDAAAAGHAGLRSASRDRRPVRMRRPGRGGTARRGDRCGHRDELEALERLATATGQRWARAVATRCRAVLGDADADEGFIAALDLHAGSTRPFEHAPDRPALRRAPASAATARRRPAAPARGAGDAARGSAPSRGRREPAASCGPAARRPVGVTRAPSPSSHPRSCRSCGS